MWTGQVAVTSSSLGCKGVPDRSGGLLVEDSGGEIVGSGFATHITDVDGQTGSQVWRTDINGPSSPPTLWVGADGTVYYSGWSNPTNLGLVALAADTGIAETSLYSAPDRQYVQSELRTNSRRAGRDQSHGPDHRAGRVSLRGANGRKL